MNEVSSLHVFLKRIVFWEGVLCPRPLFLFLFVLCPKAALRRAFYVVAFLNAAAFAVNAR